MPKIINIVDSVSALNYGIWHAAIVNAEVLKSKGFSIELWYPDHEVKLPAGVTGVKLPDNRISTLKQLLYSKSLDPDSDVIITHGAWKFPTRWGRWLKTRGFRWVYVPQGMLEPWPLRHKWLKKKIYYNLFEKRMIRDADFIRAVSRPEEKNLQILFPAQSIKFIPNGVSVPEPAEILSQQKIKVQKRSYLFLSRLHEKKNIAGLIRAWKLSKLNDKKDAELLIVGPDQGELAIILPVISQSHNMKYLGTAFGANKENIIKSATFFVLPSFSEGLPSSLLEAMGAGLIPIVTEGCNLPEAMQEPLGFGIDTSVESIKSGLEKSWSTDENILEVMSSRNRQFIADGYSLEAITSLQLSSYLKKEGSNEG